ncbi:MAG TPA: hypothetical protein VGQ36_26860 [Thermoanaerobaculia bacterium]|jgi:hypothetical protein|nr:hypothetical protein [Thermoanaerobaculia bacterium]
MPETSGLVQRLKWDRASRTVFVYLGPSPTTTRLFVMVFDSPDEVQLAFQRTAAHLLAKAQAAGFAVTVYYDNSSIITGVETYSTAVRVDALEVTQAIQNLYHSVTLVALKPTVVRVYLSYRANPPITVRGELRVSPSAAATVTIPSMNTMVLDSAQAGQLTAARNDVTRSLNFLVPAAQIVAGSLSVELVSLTDVATNTPLDLGANSPVDVTFVDSPPFRLRILGMSYEMGGQTHIPLAFDFSMVSSWLTRAYPVAQVISSQAIVAATAAPPFGCGDINAQVAAMRALDMAAGGDNRTHYYGLVADGGFFMRGCAAVPVAVPDPAAIGSGPTGDGTWGWDFDNCYGDWYTGHELGHTLGRQHPGFCGETHSDPAYPFANGQLSDADEAYVGLDVGDAALALPMTALPGTQWHDVMTYCDRQWLSSYTYEGIQTRLVAEDALGAGAGRPDERVPKKKMTAAQRAQRMDVSGIMANLISIVATVNLTQRTGKIRYVNPLSKGEVSLSVPESPVVLSVKTDDGRVLFEVRVGVKPLSDSTPENLNGLVDAVVVAQQDANVIELSIDGEVVDTYRGSQTPPAVRELRPAEEGKLAWDVERLPAGAHTYSVQASTDGGATWQTLAVGLKSPAMPIDRSQFAGARDVLIRIIATDGFRSSERVFPLGSS